MDAKKCDRCGAYYIPGIMSKFRVQGRDNLNFNWQPSNVTTFDLCYECCAELEDWMEKEVSK